MDFHFAYGSPTSRKVRIYFLEKGVEVTEHAKHRGLLPVEEVARLNPNLTTPVLFDGDVTLYDSQIMVAYVLDKYPSVLDANPPLLATLVRPERKWQDANLLSTLQTLTVSLEHIHCLDMVDNLTEKTVSYLKRESTRVNSILDWLDSQASAEGFAPGWFSLMDIMFIVHMDFSETRNGLKWRGRENLDQLYAAFADRPSVVQTRFPWMTSAAEATPGGA